MLVPLLLLLAPAVLGAATPPQPPDTSNPVQPLNGNGLPPPPSNMTLKAIALGFGIQNYTCTEKGGKPAAKGALAMLYDVTKLYPGQGQDALSQDDFDKMTTRILAKNAVPLNFNNSTEGRVDPSFPGASPTEPFPQAADLGTCKSKPLPFKGHHFFDRSGVPTFIYADGSINMSVGLVKDVDAPKSPCGTEAKTVKWLALKTKDGKGYVYRLLTAGGVSHGCDRGAGEDSSAYTATYWFYS